MRVLLTIICLFGGMLHAEGRGGAYFKSTDPAELHSLSKGMDDSLSTSVNSINGYGQTRLVHGDYSFSGIDIGTSKICQFSNKYFVAMKPDARIYDKVEWNLGDPGNPENIQVILNDNSGNDLWMNSRNINYSTIGSKNISLTFFPKGAAPVTFTENIFVYPRPAPPGVSPANFCLSGIPIPLTASLTEKSLVWYVPNPAGGFSIYSGSTPNASPIPSTASIGKTEYQVSQVSNDGCESQRVSLWVEILSAPTMAPTSPSQTYCQDAVATPLTITSTLPASTNAVWFNTPTPTITDLGSTTAPIPGTTISDVGTKDYGVKLVSTIGCGESPITTVSVTVNPKPTAPIDPATTACQNGTISLPASLPLPPAGHNVVWWGTNASGGTPSIPTLPSTATVGTQTFYASFRNATTNCESDRATITFRVHPLPDADILGSTTICQNTPIALTLRATGGLLSNYSFIYQEVGGSGGPINVVADPTTNDFSINTISTATPGTKIFNLLSVTDGRCSRPFTAKSATVTIKSNPAANLSINTPVVCEGAPAPQLTFTASGGAGTYTFTYQTSGTGGSQTITSNSSGIAILTVPTNAPNTALTYELLSVSYTDVITCTSPTPGNSRIVTIHPLPNAGVSIMGVTDPNPRFCQSSPEPQLLFTASTGTAPYTFTYTSQLGSAPTVNASVDPLASPTINIPTNVPGIHTFRPVEIRDANGCKRDLSGLAPLAVEILATPDADINASAASVCQNAAAPSVVFTGKLGTPSYTFEYDINGTIQTPASSSGTQTATLNVSTSVDNTFVYTLRSVAYTVGTTTCSKALSSSKSIKVHSLPIASLNTPAANILVCKDDARPQFTFNGTSGTSPYTFEYTRNGTAMTASGVSHLERVSTNIAENIQYRLTGISDANGCRQTATGSVDIEVAPIPVVNAGAPVWIMSGQDALLNASASNATGLTYQWSPPMFVDNPNKLQPLARPLSTTTFTLTAISDKGCSNSSSVLVTVLFQPEIPNTFTPNGDGANDRWEIKNLESYPNAVVEVYNTAGQVVFKSTGFYSPWDGTRNGMKLPVGTYYYVIHTRFNNVKRTGFITLLR